MAFTITTAAVSVIRSGTSFTIDVTAANLVEDLSSKDFVILDQTNDLVVSNTGFTKTSQTLLTYSGADIGTNISLEVRRDTPISRFQAQQFGNKFDSASYNQEIDRILGKMFEIVLFGAGTAQFFIPTPQNEAYAATWASDPVRGRTANVLYAELELCPRLADNETITGTRTFQNTILVDNTTLTIDTDASLAVNGSLNINNTTLVDNTTLTIDTDASLVVNGSLDVNGATADFVGATSVTRTTPSTATNNTEIATTAFTRNAIQTYVLDILDGIVDDKFVGQISHFGNTPPTNWLICNGATFSASTYPKLNTYLGGNTLPNYLGRFILAADGVTYLVNTTGGSANAVVVSHNHGIVDPGHVHGSVLRTGTFGLDGGGSVQQTGNTDSATTGITIGFSGVSGVGANVPQYAALNIYIYAGNPVT